MFQFCVPSPMLKSNNPGIGRYYISNLKPGCAGCGNKICSCIWDVLDDGTELLVRDFYTKIPSVTPLN